MRESIFKADIQVKIKGLFGEIMPSALLANASLGLLRHSAMSFLQRHFDSQNHSHFPFSVKTTGIDHIAVLADSNNKNIILGDKKSNLRSDLLN